MNPSFFSSLLYIAIPLVLLLVSPLCGAQTLGPGVINAPPTAIGNSQTMISDTTLNVFEDGVVGRDLQVGNADGSSTNVELHVAGGQVGLSSFGSSSFAFSANSGSQVNISGGVVGINARANAGSEVYISGGSVGLSAFGFGESAFHANSGSIVYISGGELGAGFRANSGSIVNIDAGAIGVNAASTFAPSFNAYSGSIVNIGGGTFGAYFRAFGGSEVNLSGGVFGDQFSTHTDSTVVVTGGRFGQGFTVMQGSEITFCGDEFLLNGTALTDSTVSLNEGDILSGTLSDGSVFVFSSQVGDSLVDVQFQAVELDPPDVSPLIVDSVSALKGLRSGQMVTLQEGGVLGDRLGAVNAEIEVLAGEIGYGLEISSTSLTLNGGQVGRNFTAYGGSEINLYGGNMGDSLLLLDKAVANVYFGATIGRSATVANGGGLVMTGGLIGDSLKVEPGAYFQMSGGVVGNGFRGQDGSAIQLSGGVVGQDFDAQHIQVFGTDFQRYPTPFPFDPIGTTIGQSDVITGVLEDGSVFVFSPQAGDDIGSIQFFQRDVPVASADPIVVDSGVGPHGLRANQHLTLLDGGTLPSNFATVGAALVVEGGSVGPGLELVDTEVTIGGGYVGDKVSVYSGSDLSIAGGEIGSRMTALSGSKIAVFGGRIGENFTAQPGSEILVSGGQIGDNFVLKNGAYAELAGGTFSGVQTDSGSNAIVFNGEFQGSFRASGQITILDGTFAAFTVESGASATVSGGTFSYFRPSSNSSTTVLGASLPDGVSVSGLLTIAGGRVGDGLKALKGSNVYITGGAVGDLLQAENGSTLHVSGGELGYGSRSLEGSAINLSGGHIGGDFRVEPNVTATIRAGDLELNGQPYEGLVIDLASSDVLTGTLSDGSPFVFSEQLGDRVDGFVVVPSLIHARDLTPILVTNAQAPRNLGKGQSLTLEQGGVLGDDFVALGAQVIVNDGSVGKRLELADTDIVINGGTFDTDIRMFYSNASIAGGEIGDGFYVGRGSSVEISGGSMGIGIEVQTDAVFTVDEGEVGIGKIPKFEFAIYGRSKSEINLNGGTIGSPGQEAATHALYSYGDVNIAGGVVIGRILGHVGSNLNISGGELGSVTTYGVANISGGQVYSVDASNSSRLSISGDTVIEKAGVALEDATLVMSGGSVGELTVSDESTAYLSGGEVTWRNRWTTSSTVNLLGTGFNLNGVPMDELALNQPMEISSRNVPLQATWADGSLFEVNLRNNSLQSGDYVADTVTVLVTLILPGDYNGDARVDLADYTVWRDSLGAEVNLPGDITPGNVTLADYIVWKDHFGEVFTGAVSMNTLAVPEPMSLPILVFAIVAIRSLRSSSVEVRVIRS